MGVSEVFVGDLSFFCTEADLRERFEIFGPIQNVMIKRDTQGKSLMYGFIRFRSVPSAKRAITEMRGQKFMGRAIIVHDTNSRAPKKDYSAWHKVNVYFVSFQQSQITESFLDEAFQVFGPIQDIVVRDHTVHSVQVPGSGSSPASGPPSGPIHSSSSDASVRWVSGYGVVFFSEEASAMQAVNYMDNRTTASGVNYTCTFRGRVSQPQQQGGNEASCHAQQMSLLQRRLMTLAENLPGPLQDIFMSSFGSSVESSSFSSASTTLPASVRSVTSLLDPSCTASSKLLSNRVVPSQSRKPKIMYPEDITHISLDSLPRYIAEQQSTFMDAMVMAHQQRQVDIRATYSANPPSFQQINPHESTFPTGDHFLMSGHKHPLDKPALSGNIPVSERKYDAQRGSTSGIAPHINQQRSHHTGLEYDVYDKPNLVSNESPYMRSVPSLELLYARERSSFKDHDIVHRPSSGPETYTSAGFPVTNMPTLQSNRSTRHNAGKQMSPTAYAFNNHHYLPDHQHIPDYERFSAEDATFVYQQSWAGSDASTSVGSSCASSLMSLSRHSRF